MNNFTIFFEIGFKHILNIGALDHLLFIAALSLRYQFADWKKLLFLITAFTIGHTATLTLSVLDVVDVSKRWIEFLIPLTIVATSCSNLFVKKFSFNTRFPLIYWFAVFFGFIHGLGFSSDLKMLFGNVGDGLVVKLFAANLGIETAQIIFMLLVLLIGLICTTIFKINRREYLLFISGLILGIALIFTYRNLPF